MGNTRPRAITRQVELPSEIIELIFTFCEPKTLAISIPRASKLFKKLSGDNNNVWKAKCEQKCLHLNSKPPDRTWKRFYYFPEVLKLFPFHGFTISKTTHAELLTTPGAITKKTGATEYVEYELNNFWIIDELFHMLYFIKGNTLPEEWIRQGISWDISYIDLKELLKTKVGNYNIKPHARQQDLQDNIYFTTSVFSVVREYFGKDDAIYYSISFQFNSTPDDRTLGTLEKIIIQSSDLTLKRRYYEHQHRD